MSDIRTRWAAIGAAVAISLGAGGIGLVNAAKGSGQRAIFTAVDPCRLTDTRPAFNVGPRTAPMGPGDVHTIQVTGDSGECTGIPGDVVSAQLNVTAVGATRSTHFTFWAGGPRPNASSLNPSPGEPPVPNAVTVDLSSDGTFNVYNLKGNVHLIVDLVGIHQHHHHDDRYYTEQQSDSRYYTKQQSNSRYYTKAQVDDALSSIIASGPVLLEPGTEEVLGGNDTMQVVASCGGSADGYVRIRSTVSGHVLGVRLTDESVIDPEGVEMLSFNFQAGTDSNVAAASGGFQNYQGSSFTAVAGDTTISGEANARGISASECELSFNGFVSSR